MSYWRADDSFSDHPKLLKLKRNDRWTIVEMFCYCARHRKGHIPANYHQVNRYFTKTFAQNCVDAGILEPAADGWNVHGWGDYNYTDPTNTIRQQRYRNKHRNVTRNAQSNADTVTDDTVTDITHTRARAHKNQHHTPDDDETSSSTRNAETRPTDDLDQALAAIGVNAPTRQRALTENPDRVRACLAAATRNGRNPAALFAALLTSGEWPIMSPGGDPLSGHAGMTDVNDAVERFLAGVGWDDSYDEEAMREEFRRIEGARLTTGRLELDRMMARWRELRARRYPEDAGVTA